MSMDSALLRLLRGIPNVSVVDDDAARVAAESDFGGLVRGSAHAVVRPASADALVALVAVANAEGIPLISRGLGRSQSGQSCPNEGLSVDMRCFDDVEVAPDTALVRCGGAATWRQVVARTAAHGLLPEVMPLNLDLSIGGTLSAGGTGSTSHRYGMAVSSVESLEVITGAGELVLATRELRRDVYDAVLGGVGQFGFICAAELRLRRIQPLTRTFFLLYDDLATLLADQRRLMAEPWCTHLEGFASAAVQGLRRGPQGRPVPFARWFYGLQVSTEYAPDIQPRTEHCLAGLGYRELVHSEANDTVEFAARYDLRFEMMRATGAWEQRHPWLECLLPWTTALDLLPEIVSRVPLFLGDGHRIMILADVERPALLMHPVESPAIALAILPIGVPSAFEAPALAALRGIHETLVAAGGKRYLSGWLFEPDEAAWRLHYGESFEVWRARKRELDPQGILRSRLPMP